MNFWAEQIARGSQNRPNEPVFWDTHSKISFSELDTFTRTFTAELESRGLKTSDRVLLILPRGVSSAAITAALLTFDLPTLAIERANISSSLTDTLAALDPHGVIFLEPDRKSILTRSQITDDFAIPTPFASRDSVRFALRVPTSAKSQPVDLGWLLQTSGTTRAPRLVMISRKNLVDRAKSEVRDFNLTSKDQIINPLSFTHDVGFNQLLATLASLSTLKIQNQPFALALLNWIRLGTASGVSATPLLWNQVLALSQESFAELRYVAISGGSLLPADLRRLAKMFPNAELIRTYGQTETFRSLINRSDDIDTQGSPLEGVKLQIAPNGELIHSGVGTTLGYFGAPEATKEKLSIEGVHTGDIFEIAANGHYKFKGRRDDMIKRFEIRMHLKEIEEAIAEIPGITSVALVTKPSARDDARENLIAAFVTLTAGTVTTSSELAIACKLKLEPAKQPDLIEILSEMPKTPSHKVDRAALLKLWAAK